MDNLISAHQLLDVLDREDLKVIDASWYLPSMKRAAFDEYKVNHIPGAVFFDLDRYSDQASPLPHMMPDAETFAFTLGKLGLSQDDDVVVYDGMGLFSAPRVWWMLKIMGMKRVRVLNGGLPVWQEAELPIEMGENTLPACSFIPDLQEGAIAFYSDVLNVLQSDNVDVIDARSADRFAGRVPEPRPELRSGHAPSMKNLPFNHLMGRDGLMKDPSELKALFHSIGVMGDKPIITSCGSGVTAAVLVLGLAEIGITDVRLYDGSWAEWGAKPDAPVIVEP